MGESEPSLLIESTDSMWHWTADNPSCWVCAPESYSYGDNFCISVLYTKIKITEIWTSNFLHELWLWNAWWYFTSNFYKIFERPRSAERSSSRKFVFFQLHLEVHLVASASRLSGIFLMPVTNRHHPLDWISVRVVRYMFWRHTGNQNPAFNKESMLSANLTKM